MNTSKKIAIGLGLVGSALLAAWLLTGERRKKTKEFVSKAANDLKNAFGREPRKKDYSDVHHV